MLHLRAKDAVRTRGQLLPGRRGALREAPGRKLRLPMRQVQLRQDRGTAEARHQGLGVLHDMPVIKNNKSTSFVCLL